MFCQHCGAQLPNSAKFCTECGAPIGYTSSPSQFYETGKLRVSRQSAMMASAMKTKVFVDGELKDTVGDGNTVSFLLAVGTHSVELKTPGNKGIVQTITISPDTETVLRFKLSMMADGYHEVLGISDVLSQPTSASRTIPIVVDATQQMVNTARQGRICPKCGGAMVIQTVSESRKTGCLTIILYFILAITILGLLILIPLALRRKTETVTYAVCQECGYKNLVSHS